MDRASTLLPPVRGRQWARAIVHLHSPWSHDACDGNGLPDGKPNEPCLASLRAALCDVGIDYAFLTDHPDYAAWQSYDDLFMQREDDERVAGVNTIFCEGGKTFWSPGVEDELMPVGLDRHVAGTSEESHHVYNEYTDESVQAELNAGAKVFVAHTEQRKIEDLTRLQDAGLTGIEVFNLHAMFAPNIREEHLGLSAFGWLEDAYPFINPNGTGEPDLLFLAVLQEQPQSTGAWDALLARGPAVGIGGTDAHENSLPMLLRDGERGDSYRRSMSWFANYLLVDDLTPDAGEKALAEGRLWVIFHVLGVPSDLDVHLIDAQGTIYEVGSDAPSGDLHVSCPTLQSRSPRGDLQPEVQVTVYRDGVQWQTKCGVFPADTGHTYRVRVDITPHHLISFLGANPQPWLRPFPWAYSNAIRVGM
ncbi:MAG: hypothetical protein ACI9MC_000417 [Kiritimatiellia bacterium]|jgi:hypothetical protein